MNKTHFNFLDFGIPFVFSQSFEVGNACFMSEWYKFGPRRNKMLFLIMERSKRPLTISAYKFSVLSLSAYIKVNILIRISIFKFSQKQL